jgi:hypothetical protein
MARIIKDAQRLEIFDVPFPIVELAPWHDRGEPGRFVDNDFSVFQKTA